MIGKTLKTVTAFFMLSVLVATGARAESLTDALISAYKNSGLLQQNRALLRAADEGVARAVSGLRPVVNYALGAQYSSITETTSSNLQLTASMMLFDFGRSKLRVEVARENVLALREALVGVEQSVLLRAVAAFANMRRDTSIVGLRENNLRLITEELRAAQDRFDVGEITRTDVAIAQARLASSDSALAAARGNLAVSREEYRSAVGHAPGNLSALPKPPATAKSAASARALARQRHPDMAQAQHSVTIADINVELARAAIKPALTGSARASIDQNGNDSSSIGVTLSGPIYQGGALTSAYRQAVAQRDAARAGLHLAGLKVDQDVGNAWARLTVADARLQATEQQIRASQVAYRGTKQEAEVGSRTTLDVLNAEQELLDAQSGQISARTDRYIAVYNLLAAMGLLTADHLRLGLATYDPAAYYDAVKSAPTYRVSPQGKKLDSLLKSIGKK